MSSKKKRGRKSSDNLDDSVSSAYQSALENLSSLSPSVPLEPHTPDKDSSLSDVGSNFATPVAAGTPTKSIAAQFIAGERQQVASVPTDKQLFIQIDDSLDNYKPDTSFIDLTLSDIGDISNVEKPSITISSNDSTPEKLNISPAAHKVNALEEIVIISDEDDSIDKTDDESEGNTTYDERGNTVVSTTIDPQTPDLTISSNSSGTDIDIIKMYKSIEEFDENLPPTVTLLTNELGSKVYIVGTAHFSRESQDDVSLVIRNVCPDIVLVELCAARVHMLSYDEKTLLEEAKNINFAKIRSITKANGLLNGLFYILMLNMSAKITEDLGLAPGGEFRRALEELKNLPVNNATVLHLGDRSINVTLQRAFNGLSLWQTIKIVSKLIFSNKTITKEEVEQCKQKDLLEELMEQMAGEYPVFREVFVNERDLYLCHSLTLAAAQTRLLPNGKSRPVKVVGVVGIGHSAGIAKNWGKVDESQIPAILVVPPARLSTRVFKATVKYGLLTLISYGVFRIIRPRVQSLFSITI